MAEQDEDESQKTEDPTPRKLEKAKQKGQTAVSQEVKHWGVLLGGAMSLVFLAPGIARGITEVSLKFLEQADRISVDFNHLRFAFGELAADLLWILWPLMLLLMVLAVAASLFQSGWILAPERIKPDPQKISPVAGVKRLVSAKGLVEFAKGVAKIVVVGVVAFGMTLPMMDDVALIPLMDIHYTLDRMWILAIQFTIGTLIVMTVVAALDYMFQKYSFIKQMRMTKQEVKDEHRQSEGDPQVKARIRQLRMERARKRMMAAVPEADVVVTNPTHYAVALKYEMDSMQAPLLVAKGADNVAFRIREVAEENEVPVVENPPLARALYASVELDEEIPVEHYQAVAEVIGYVMRLKGGVL